MMDKFSTCEYCTKRGPLLQGGGFTCAFTGSRMLSKHGHCEYHEAIAQTDITLDLADEGEEAQIGLF